MERGGKGGGGGGVRCERGVGSKRLSFKQVV